MSKGRWIVLMCEKVNWQRTSEKSNLSPVQTSLRVKGTVLAKQMAVGEFYQTYSSNSLLQGLVPIVTHWLVLSSASSTLRKAQTKL